MRFFSGFPMYGTRAGVTSRVSSRFSFSALIAFPFHLEDPIAFAYYVEADIARAATSASVLRAVPAVPNGDFLLRLYALGSIRRRTVFRASHLRQLGRGFVQMLIT